MLAVEGDDSRCLRWFGFYANLMDTLSGLHRIKSFSIHFWIVGALSHQAISSLVEAVPATGSSNTDNQQWEIKKPINLMLKHTRLVVQPYFSLGKMILHVPSPHQNTKRTAATPIYNQQPIMTQALVLRTQAISAPIYLGSHDTRLYHTPQRTSRTRAQPGLMMHHHTDHVQQGSPKKK